MSLFDLVAKFLPFPLTSTPIATPPAANVTQANTIVQRNRLARTRLIKIDAAGRTTRFLPTARTTTSTSRQGIYGNNDYRPLAKLPHKSANALGVASGAKENAQKGVGSIAWPAALSTLPDAKVSRAPRSKPTAARHDTRPLPPTSAPAVSPVAPRAVKRRASHTLDTEGPVPVRTAKKVKTVHVAAVGDKRRARNDEENTGDVERPSKKAKLAHQRGILKPSKPTAPVPVPVQAPAARKRLHWCRTVVGGEGRHAPLVFTPATLRPRAQEAPAVPRSQQTPKTPVRYADDMNAFLNKDSRGVHKMPAFVPARFMIPGWHARWLMFDKLLRIHANMHKYDSPIERAIRARNRRRLLAPNVIAAAKGCKPAM